MRLVGRVPAATAGLFAAIIAAAQPATGAPPTMSECLSANESAIALRSEHRLRQAREQALICAATSCPGEVRDACLLRVRDLNAAIPSIVFLAKDDGGRDLVAATVSMDGEQIGDRLDGTAIPVDPGQHKFVFEVPGRPPIERSLVVSEGQKDRRETITIASTSATLVPASPLGARTGSSAILPPASGGAHVGPASADAPSGEGRRIAGVIVGAMGVVGLALGGVFGGIAESKWSSAKAYCDGMPVSCTASQGSTGFQDEHSASTMATLSTVSLITGGVLATGGVVIFLTALKETSSARHVSSSPIEVTATSEPRGWGMLVRGWF
jgi:hypothetical protein